MRFFGRFLPEFHWADLIPPLAHHWRIAYLAVKASRFAEAEFMYFGKMEKLLRRAQGGNLTGAVRRTGLLKK